MKKIYLTKRSKFIASHSHSGILKEGRHKHTFQYEITLCGKANSEGFLTDFKEIEKTLNKKINEILQGRNLNSIIARPTTENITLWIYARLKPVYKNLLCSVRVYEAKDRFVTYFGK